MFKSVRGKLVCAFAVFLLAFAGLQIIFNLFFAQKVYIFQKKQEINQVFDLIKSNYTDSHEELYNLLSKYEEKYNIRAVIFAESEDERGRIIYASIPDWKLEKRDFMPFPIRPNENKDVYSENAQAVLRDDPRGDIKNLFLKGIVNFDGEKRYVSLESPVSSIQQTVTVTTKMTVWLLLFLMALGMMFFYLFACRLTKPIKEVDAVAQSVVNLDFTKKASETGKKDEISNLAHNINIMSDRISDMINKLTEANKKLEADIEYKTKLEGIRREFVANVSHELKTPIALLMGYAEILKSDIPDIDKDFYCDVITDESEKMNKLVCQLLDVSRMENELADLNFEDVNLKETAQWIIEKHKIHMDENEQTCEFIGEEIHASCDKLKIEQCITNYISNACFHSPKGSKIIVRLYKEGENAVFSVFNEGSHIDDNDMDKIWNIFYKADKSRSERKSTGLGLYIVSSVINAHKGEYGAKNRDGGVEFWFKIKIFQN